MLNSAFLYFIHCFFYFNIIIKSVIYNFFIINCKWIVPYYFSNDVPEWMKDQIEDYLSDFGTNTCVEARRVSYSEKKWTNRVKFAYLHDEETV